MWQIVNVGFKCVSMYILESPGDWNLSVKQPVTLIFIQDKQSKNKNLIDKTFY